MAEQPSEKEIIESLRTQLEYLENDFIVTKKEFEDSTAEYLEMIREKEILLQKIKRSEEKFRSLYTSMNEGVCIHEIVPDERGNIKDYIILDINPAYESIFKLKKDAVIGKRASEVFETENPPYLETYVKVAITGENCSFETYSKSLNKHFYISAFSPKKNHFVTVLTDITDRKQYESALLKSQKHLNSVVKTIPDIVYRLDEYGIITFINDAIRPYGYEPEELIGKSIFEIIHVDDRGKAKYRIDERRTGKRSTKSLEVRLLTKQHDTVSFDMQTDDIPLQEAFFRIDAEGLYYSNVPREKSFFGTQGIARDLSERKEWEDHLKRKETVFEKALSLTDSGCWEYNPQTEGMWWSDEMYTLFDLDTSAERPSFDLFLELIHPSDREIVIDAFNNAQNEISFNFECRVLLRSGDEKSVTLKAEFTNIHAYDEFTLIGIIQFK